MDGKGENATDRTQPLWPTSVDPSVPVRESQILIVPSIDPDVSSWLSDESKLGESARVKIQESWD